MGCRKLTYRSEGSRLKVVSNNLKTNAKCRVGLYRYGFQGQEKDDEVKGEGNSVNYKFRMHDPRIGRFFAVDPLAPKYPHYSPYMFSGNKVISAVELEGLEESSIHDKVPVINNVEKNCTDCPVNSSNLMTPSGTSVVVGDNFYTHGDYLLGGNVTYKWDRELMSYTPYEGKLPEEFKQIEDFIPWQDGDEFIYSGDKDMVVPFRFNGVLPYYHDEELFKEFKYGIGPKNRVFGPENSMTKSIMESHTVLGAKEYFLELIANGSDKVQEKNGYQYFSDDQNRFNFSQHFYDEMPRAYTGGHITTLIKKVDSDDIFVVVSNATGRYSYYLHLPFVKDRKTSTGAPNGWVRNFEENIYQYYLFKIK